MWTILHQLLIFVLLLFKRGNDTLTLVFFFYNPFLCFKMWTILHQLLIFVLLLFKRGNDTSTLSFYYSFLCLKMWTWKKINYWYLFCCYLKEAMILLHFLFIIHFYVSKCGHEKSESGWKWVSENIYIYIYIYILKKEQNNRSILWVVTGWLCFSSNLSQWN